MSVGGSIIVPEAADTGFIRRFVRLLTKRMEGPSAPRYALVVGGGATARTYQKALRDVDPDAAPDVLDLVGIAATRVNATLVGAAFGSHWNDPLVEDPTTVKGISGSVLLAGGWKPGFSTDNVAVRLAESLGAKTLLNLSNINRIYTADPKKDPDARPLTKTSWDELLSIIGDEWVPGKNTPFDPVAARRAAELGMTVITADGRDLENLCNLLDGKAFVGTTVEP
jgi:uridylate kinase